MHTTFHPTCTLIPLSFLTRNCTKPYNLSKALNYQIQTLNSATHTLSFLYSLCIFWLCAAGGHTPADLPDEQPHLPHRVHSRGGAVGHQGTRHLRLRLACDAHLPSLHSLSQPTFHVRRSSARAFVERVRRGFVGCESALVGRYCPCGVVPTLPITKFRTESALVANCAGGLFWYPPLVLWLPCSDMHHQKHKKPTPYFCGCGLFTCLVQ
jgi:hypothetical protein